MEEQKAIDFVKKEISEYVEYLYKFKSLAEFYKATKNIITFRFEHEIYSFEEAKEAFEYLDEFYKKQSVVEEKQNKASAEYKQDREEDDEER